MYLRFDSQQKLVEIGRLIAPSLSEEELCWDQENVYEWLDFFLPEFDIRLNVSREHGMANISAAQEELLNSQGRNIEEITVRGRTYINGTFLITSHDACEIAQIFSDRLGHEVHLCEGKYYVDAIEPTSFTVFHPNKAKEG